MAGFITQQELEAAGLHIATPEEAGCTHVDEPCELDHLSMTTADLFYHLIEEHGIYEEALNPDRTWPKFRARDLHPDTWNGAYH